MLEIELKFRAADWALLEDTLRAAGGPPADEHVEADHYFNAPDRDFGVTGEAFRLRRIGDTSVLTYKGPKEPTAVKTRTEIEVPIADGDGPAADMATLLTRLGYRPVAVVRKTRRVYRLARGGFAVSACLDEVEQVGRFVELEIVADAERREAAQTALLGLAADLGLTDDEKRSYLGMLLARS